MSGTLRRLALLYNAFLVPLAAAGLGATALCKDGCRLAGVALAASSPFLAYLAVVLLLRRRGGHIE